MALDVVLDLWDQVSKPRFARKNDFQVGPLLLVQRLDVHWEIPWNLIRLGALDNYEFRNSLVDREVGVGDEP